MKSVFRWILITLLIAALLWLVPSEKVVAETVNIFRNQQNQSEEAADGEAEALPALTEEETAAADAAAPSGGRIVPIPLDLRILPEVDERYYLSETEYEDPSLSVKLTSGRRYDTDYIIARVKIADPSQLRSALHSKDGKHGTYGDRLAKKVHAVLAFNGDSFRDNKPNDTRKYVIRQGQDVFLQKWGEKKNFFDILMIDDEANLHVLLQPTQPEVEAFVASHNIINSFCFGPVLVLDGVRQEKPENSQRANGVGWGKAAQRVCLCQTGTLEYAVVVSAGEDCPGNSGMTMDEFLDVVMDEVNPRIAYNLDGGNSTWLVFHDTRQNYFGRGPSQGKREIADIIYFASAWQADPVTGAEGE